jgi:hypothetical protein
MVDFLSLLGSKSLVLDAAFQMQKKDNVMGISIYIGIFASSQFAMSATR